MASGRPVSEIMANCSVADIPTTKDLTIQVWGESVNAVSPLPSRCGDEMWEKVCGHLYSGRDCLGHHVPPLAPPQLPLTPPLPSLFFRWTQRVRLYCSPSTA